MGGKVRGTHLNGICAKHGGHECSFPVEDTPCKDHTKVSGQGWVARFEVQNHLSEGEYAMLSHVAACLVPFADHIPDTCFKGMPQQGLIRCDIHDLDAAFHQFSYGRKITSRDPDKAGSVFFYPGQLGIPERVFRQRHDIHCIRPCSHDLRQPSQPIMKGLLVHQAQGDGG